VCSSDLIGEKNPQSCFEEKICNLQLTIPYFFLKTTMCFLYTN